MVHNQLILQIEPNIKPKIIITQGTLTSSQIEHMNIMRKNYLF